mgnify:CR=1 FL=1
MCQKSFTSGFEKHNKKTRKERFLDEMDQVIPWKRLTEARAPYCPDPQGAGRHHSPAPGRRARSGDVSNPEGQLVVLRAEGAHWPGQRH